MDLQMLGFAMGLPFLIFYLSGGLQDQARGRTGLQLDESRLPGSHRWSVLFEHLHGLVGERMATTCYNHRWMRWLKYAEIPRMAHLCTFMHIYAHVSFTNLCWTFCGVVLSFPGIQFWRGQSSPNQLWRGSASSNVVAQWFTAHLGALG